jgi:hypothetical protein
MTSKAILLEDALVAALQRFAVAPGCCWIVTRFSNDSLLLAAENHGDFNGFCSAMQVLDSSSSGSTATTFAVLKVNLSEAKGGLQVDSLGRQKTVFFTFVPATATALERASMSEAKSAVRVALGVVVHVEYTVENVDDLEEAAVLTRVKQSTGGTRFALASSQLFLPYRKTHLFLLQPSMTQVLQVRTRCPLLNSAAVCSVLNFCDSSCRPPNLLARRLQCNTRSRKNLGEARASCCELIFITCKASRAI